jgi:hypothetical protein
MNADDSQTLEAHGNGFFLGAPDLFTANCCLDFYLRSSAFICGY